MPTNKSIVTIPAPIRIGKLELDFVLVREAGAETLDLELLFGVDGFSIGFSNGEDPPALLF